MKDENKFCFILVGKEAKHKEIGKTTIPKRKYKKEWNYELLGKMVYNDTVDWIKKNTTYTDVAFSNKAIVMMSQELNKKKARYITQSKCANLLPIY